MYGLIDVAYGSHKTEATAGTTSQKTGGIMDGALAGSRFGFRGVEDLGGGMKASFTLEQGISPTSANGYNYRVGSAGHQITNGTTYSLGNNRQSFIGLSGGFGEINAGYVYTNAYQVAGTMSGMGGEMQGTSNHLAGLVGGSRFTGVKYIAPAFGAVKLQLEMGSAAGQRATQEATTDQKDGYQINNQAVTSVSAVYAKGPLYAGLVYTQNKKEQTANSATTTNIWGGTVTAGTALNRTETATQVVGTYDFGAAKVGGTWVKADKNTAGGGDTTGKQLAVNVPVGAVTLLAVTGTTKTTDSSADVKSQAIGFKYSLSKRTTAYGYHGKDKNAGTAATALDVDTKTVVGLAHSF